MCRVPSVHRFASFLGKVLAELALDGKTQYDIDGFRFQRDAVQNSSFPLAFWRGDMTSARL